MSALGLRVGIVGGSIAGLAAAAALRRVGAQVEVFERARGRDQSPGSGISVDLDLVAQVTQGDEQAVPHLPLSRRRVDADGTVADERTSIAVSAYHLLRDHLRASVPGDGYTPGCEVESIDAPAAGSLHLHLAGGERRAVDAVIIADGRRSRLRGLVANTGRARYAGYMLVRGLVEEEALPDATRQHVFEAEGASSALHVVSRGRYQLVAFPVPGAKGEVVPGRRRLNFGWYYGVPENRLREELLPGHAASHAVSASTPPPDGEAPMLQAAAPHADVAAALLDEADVLWPAPYAAVVHTASAVGSLSLHPVYEHFPDRLASGRIAVAGDAAHLASPITGSGARMALLDALALEEAFRQEGVDVVRALRRYQATRLAPSVAIVAHGRSAGATFRGV